MAAATLQRAHMSRVEIDKGSGFCFGVTRAIGKAEEELQQGHTLYCLGDIVHNGREVERLRQMGLITISHQEMAGLQGRRVLLRAHGEPPQTYALAQEQGIQLVDATCPVVLHLQERIKKEYDADPEHQKQIVIYGKMGHAEVLGLVGQTEGTAIVIESLEDAERLDFGRDICLFSQTTKSLEGFGAIVRYIEEHMQEGATFKYADTICRQVANRMSHIRDFASCHDIILFVCGHKSSNGRVLFDECRAVNEHAYMIDSPGEIKPAFLDVQGEVRGVSNTSHALSIGICGATSTPEWLMEQCKVRVEEMLGSHE